MNFAAFTVRIGACFASAVLLFASQTWEALSPAAALALVPWLNATERSRFPAAFAMSALTAMIYGCLVGHWIVGALQVLGSSRTSATFGLVLAALWIKVPLFVLMGTAAWMTRRRHALVAMAILAGTTFAGESAASYTTWGIPWALLGHSQLPLLGVSQLAVVGGVPLISALLAALNLSIARLLSAGDAAAIRTAWAIGGAWVSLALFGLPASEALRPRAQGPAYRLLIVQPDIPRSDRWGHEHQALNLRRVRQFVGRDQRQLAGVAAILLPENLLTSPVDAHPDLASGLTEWVDQIGVPVITGLAMADSEGSSALYHSSVVWIEPGAGFTARIDKVRAVPLFESSRDLPGQHLMVPLVGAASGWKKVVEVPSEGPLQGRFPVTSALCYEALFPGIIAAKRTPESVAIVNVADDGWVSGDTATRQLTRYASFRAIEQRLTLIRVAHGGLSAVVDPFGRLLEELPLDVYAMAHVEVAASPPPTLAEQIAIFALPSATGAALWWSFGIRTRGRRSR